MEQFQEHTDGEPVWWGSLLGCAGRGGAGGCREVWGNILIPNIHILNIHILNVYGGLWDV